MPTTNPLTLKQAVEIAVDCINYRIRYYAFNANLHDKLNDNSHECAIASLRKANLEQAIAVLQSLADHGATIVRQHKLSNFD